MAVGEIVQGLPENHWIRQTAPDCANWLEVITVAWAEQVRCVESLSTESRDQIRATLNSQTAPNVDWYPTPDFDEDLALLMAGKLDA